VYRDEKEKKSSRTDGFAFLEPKREARRCDDLVKKKKRGGDTDQLRGRDQRGREGVTDSVKKLGERRKLSKGNDRDEKGGGGGMVRGGCNWENRGKKRGSILPFVLLQRGGGGKVFS